LDQAIDIIESLDLETIAAGKTVLLPDAVTVARHEYETKPQVECKWEAHRQWADIQIVLKGEEMIAYAPLAETSVKLEYNPEKDVIILNGQGDLVRLSPGRFGIFLPQDAHQPGGQVGVPMSVQKVVFKVRLP
jgi:YhcH/YjgK/YiaL family protein